MSASLPKVRRTGSTGSPAVYVLIGIIVILMGMVVYLFVSGSWFDEGPSTLLERDYALLLDGLAENPENPAVLMTIAETEYELGKESQSLEHAESAWEFGQDVIGIPRRYAQIMMLFDRLDEARIAVQREIELDDQGENAEPLFLLAQIDWAAGDLDAAIETMQQALSIDYMAADMRILYAELLEEAGRVDEAIAEYQQALTFLPGDVRAVGGLERLGVTVEETETVNPHESGTPMTTDDTSEGE